MEVGGQNNAQATLPPKETRYYYTGGRMGLRAGLNRCEISRPHRGKIAEPSKM
jgi:hypothetical protein